MGLFGSMPILGPLIVITCLNQVSSVRFYRLPPTFTLTSNEVDHVTTNSVWTCFANAEANDPEWTHFYFDASSSRCSLRGGLVSFDFTTVQPMGTPGTPLPGNFYVKDVAGRLAAVDGCPAETVLHDLVCALPEPLSPGKADCRVLESLVRITSANETELTNAFFRGKCSEYGRSLYSTTAPYRQSVVRALWNKTLTVANRIHKAAATLDSIGDDDERIKKRSTGVPLWRMGHRLRLSGLRKAAISFGCDQTEEVHGQDCYGRADKDPSREHVGRTYMDCCYRHRSVISRDYNSNAYI